MSRWNGFEQVIYFGFEGFHCICKLYAVCVSTNVLLYPYNCNFTSNRFSFSLALRSTRKFHLIQAARLIRTTKENNQKLANCWGIYHDLSCVQVIDLCCRSLNIKFKLNKIGSARTVTEQFKQICVLFSPDQSPYFVDVFIKIIFCS